MMTWFTSKFKFLKLRWVQILLGLTLLYFLYSFFFSQDEKVRSNRIVVAKETTWFSFNLFGKENNVSAFSDELLFLIAEESNFNVDTVTSSVNTLLPALRDGTYDALILPVLEKPQLDTRDLLFSQSYLALGPVLIVKKEAPFMTTESLKGKTLGIEQGSTILTYLDEYPQLNVKVIPDIWTGLENLAKGRLDAFIADALPASIYIESRYKNILKIQSPAITHAGLKLVTYNNKRGAKLIETFNEGLFDIIKDGRYDALLLEWGFSDYPDPLFTNIK